MDNFPLVASANVLSLAANVSGRLLSNSDQPRGSQLET
jgi:hypothetical protein